MTSEWLFNSFIPPNFYTPPNKFLATLLNGGCNNKTTGGKSIAKWWRWWWLVRLVRRCSHLHLFANFQACGFALVGEKNNNKICSSGFQSFCSISTLFFFVIALPKLLLSDCHIWWTIGEGTNHPTNQQTRLIAIPPDREVGAITSKIKHATKHARLAQLLQPSLAFCFSLQPMTAHRPVRRHWLQAKTKWLRAATVVQVSHGLF